MSDSEAPVAPGDPDLDAAEYVLGTMDAAEAQAAAARIAADSGFASLVTAWENRLTPLAALVSAVPPPATLWPRIEDSTGGSAAARSNAAPQPRASNDNSPGFWRVTALASMAIAAGLAAFIVLRPPPPPPLIAQAVVSHPVVAVLSPAAGVSGVLIAVADPIGALQIRAVSAVTVPADRDLELWSLPTGATKPASLGVLPAAGKQVPAGVAVGTALLVSLEPHGGSPTGQPTGPVVFSGKLTDYQ